MLSHHTLSDQVLDYCAQPRSMAEIEAQFWTEGQRTRFTVYNLRQRGQLINLNAEGAASRRAGLFVAGKPAPRAEVLQRAGLSFSAMAAFWGRETC